AAGHRHLEQVSGFPGHPDAVGTRLLGTALRSLGGILRARRRACRSHPDAGSRARARHPVARNRREAQAARDADGIFAAGEAPRRDPRRARARAAACPQSRPPQVKSCHGSWILPPPPKGPCGTTIEELAWRRSSCSSSTVRSIASLARDRKSTRLNSSHVAISYAVFCLKKKKQIENQENVR